MKSKHILAGLLLAVLAGIWGLCFGLEPQKEEVCLEAVSFGGEDSEGLEVLRPGEIAERGVRFRNSGPAACQLRVRVCAASVEGQPVLQAGHMGKNGFYETGSGVPASQTEEYWTAKGEYLYYQNGRTGDLLLPGRETPPLYTAVRMASLSQEDLDTLRALEPDQRLYVLAQARPGGASGWQEAGAP